MFLVHKETNILYWYDEMDDIYYKYINKCLIYEETKENNYLISNFIYKVFNDYSIFLKDNIYYLKQLNYPVIKIDFDVNTIVKIIKNCIFTINKIYYIDNYNYSTIIKKKDLNKIIKNKKCTNYDYNYIQYEDILMIPTNNFSIYNNKHIKELCTKYIDLIILKNIKELKDGYIITNNNKYITFIDDILTYCWSYHSIINIIFYLYYKNLIPDKNSVLGSNNNEITIYDDIFYNKTTDKYYINNSELLIDTNYSIYKNKISTKSARKIL